MNAINQDHFTSQQLHIMQTLIQQTIMRPIRAAKAGEIVLAESPELDMNEFASDLALSLKTLKQTETLAESKGYLRFVGKQTDKKTRSQILLEAQMLIEAAMSDLDINSTTCGSCGLNHRENFEEFQMWTELKAMSQKLFKMSNDRKKGAKNVKSNSDRRN